MVERSDSVPLFPGPGPRESQLLRLAWRSTPLAVQVGNRRLPLPFSLVVRAAYLEGAARAGQVLIDANATSAALMSNGRPRPVRRAGLRTAFGATAALLLVATIPSLVATAVVLAGGSPAVALLATAAVAVAGGAELGTSGFRAWRQAQRDEDTLDPLRSGGADVWHIKEIDTGVPVSPRNAMWSRIFQRFDQLPDAVVALDVRSPALWQLAADHGFLPDPGTGELVRRAVTEPAPRTTEQGRPPESGFSAASGQAPGPARRWGAGRSGAAPVEGEARGDRPPPPRPEAASREQPGDPQGRRQTGP